MTKIILHVDGDNFFVACEVARFPHLKGKPVVVGEERGIASALSYEAKKLGLSRASPIHEIRKNFPQVVILSSHFELYEQYNHKLFSILQKYSSNVERYSIDECFAEIKDSDIKKFKQKYNTDLLEAIKKDAETSLGISLSFGLATTKTLAKIASKYKKPSGCVAMTEHEDPFNREKLLQETPIGSVWGIGRAISASLTSYNILTAYDFTLLEPQFVKKNFGEGTLNTWYELRGSQRYEVEHNHDQQKSFQSTRSFGMSTVERSFLLSELSTNVEILCARLREANLKTKRVSFFLKKNTDYDRYISSEIDIGFYTNSESDILKRIKENFEPIYAQGLGFESKLTSDEPKYGSNSINANKGFDRFIKRLGYKATGVSVYGLKAPADVSDDLFGTQSTRDIKNAYIDAVDQLKSRFGDKSIHLASSLQSRKRRTQLHEERNSRNKYIYGLPLPYMGEAI